MLETEMRSLRLIRKLVRDVWPVVDQRLEEYKRLSRQAEDEILARQALSSIKHKRFHALGGSTYALYPGTDLSYTVDFITALQTISDYLDNLCDRAGVKDEQAFRQLHLSMLDAVEPSAAISDYYLFYPYKSDNGYLEALVEKCRQAAGEAVSYHLVKGKITRLVDLYSNMQTYKHLDLNIREEKLTAWAKNHKEDQPEISRWEFSAAAGSTLGMFILYAAAFDPGLTETEAGLIHSAYFPWISGLHILLDYYIDSDEDKNEGDLNFTHYYDNLEHCRQRLSFFIGHSIESCSKLKYPDFHMTVVRGLLAMYLSDPKARAGPNGQISRKLVRTGGSESYLYWHICSLLRRRGIL